MVCTPTCALMAPSTVSVPTGAWQKSQPYRAFLATSAEEAEFGLLAMGTDPDEDGGAPSQWRAAAAAIAAAASGGSVTTPTKKTGGAPAAAVAGGLYKAMSAPIEGGGGGGFGRPSDPSSIASGEAGSEVAAEEAVIVEEEVFENERFQPFRWGAAGGHRVVRYGSGGSGRKEFMPLAYMTHKDGPLHPSPPSPSPSPRLWGHTWPGHFLPSDRVGHWCDRMGGPAGPANMSFDQVAPRLPNDGWR